VQPALRGGFGRSASLNGRRGFQGPQGNNGNPQPRVQVPPDQQNQNDSGAVQQ
jgi:hypothetical protein